MDQLGPGRTNLVRVPRPTKQQIDDEIIDAAAALFARFGFAETPVQRVADAVGYSKTGLLHRFPTKEALQDAVAARWTEELRGVAAGVRDQPVGPGRDRAVLTALAALAFRRPGIVALVVKALTNDNDLASALPVSTDLLFDAFGADKEADRDRSLRIGVAVAGLAVVSVAASRLDDAAALRTHLIDASYDALGHHRPAE